MWCDYFLFSFFFVFIIFVFALFFFFLSFFFFFLQRKTQGSCISEHDMQMVEVEYTQLAEKKAHQMKVYNNPMIYANVMHEYDAGMICPL